MYTLIRLLAGGTFTTGVAADWRTQFIDGGTVAAIPTLAGEIFVPGSGTTYGVYAAFAFASLNPFDFEAIVNEASVGAPVQVYVNGVLVSEVASAASLTCSAIGGANVVEVVRSQAPLAFAPAGPLFVPGSRTSRWISLFPAGADPFLGSAGPHDRAIGTGV
jgi:hypothetical protein